MRETPKISWVWTTSIGTRRKTDASFPGSETNAEPARSEKDEWLRWLTPLDNTGRDAAVPAQRQAWHDEDTVRAHQTSRGETDIGDLREPGRHRTDPSSRRGASSINDRREPGRHRTGSLSRRGAFSIRDPRRGEAERVPRRESPVPAEPRRSVRNAVRLAPAIAILIGASACQKVDSLPPWTALTEGAGAVLFGVGDPEAPRLFGIDLQDEASMPFSFSAARDGDLLLAVYDRTLPELALAPGPIALAMPGDPGRPLPAWRAAFSARRSETGVSEWTALEEQASLPDLFRLPGVELETCLLANGCYADPRDIEARVCSTPCTSRAGPAPPEPPTEPSPPVWSPCPLGWAVRIIEDVQTCEPPAPTACAAVDAVQWLSQPTCTTVGTACPEPPGQWAPDLPSDRPVIYVRAGAVAGDGSMGAPFGDIRDAVTAAPDESVVALTADVYPEDVFLPSGVTLWGACVSGTVIRAPPGTRLSTQGGAGLRNLRIQGGEGGLIVPGGAGAMAIQDVIVEPGAVRPAIEVRNGGTLQGSRVVVRAGIGRGLSVVAGRAELAQVVIEDGNVEVTDLNAVVRLDDVRLSRNPTGPVVLQGARVDRNAELTLRGFRVSGFLLSGLQVTGGARLELEDGIVENIGGSGVAAGVETLGGARLDAARMRLEGIDGPGIEIANAQGFIEDLWVRAPAEGFERGHVTVTRAVLDAERLQLDDGRRWGFWAEGSGAQATLRDITIRRVPAVDDPTIQDTGVGMWLGQGASFDGRRILIEDAGSHGVLGFTGRVDPPRPNADARFSDLTIRRTTAGPGGGGFGMLLSVGAQGWQIERARVEDSQEHGVFVVADAVAHFEDLYVEGAEQAFRITEEAVVTGARWHLEASRSVGLCVRASTRATLEDVTIEATLGPDAEGSDCVFGVPTDGNGIAVNNLSRLELNRYAVRRAFGIGLVVRSPGSVLATDGRFFQMPTGIQIAPEVELDALLTRTVFDDVGVPLDRQ